MKKVYAYLCLDILHLGHVRYLERAKNLVGSNGKLIIGILSDDAVMEKKARPIIPFSDRLEIAKSIRYVDEVVEQITYSPIDNIITIKPDFIVESESHCEEDIREVADAAKKIHSQVVILDYYKPVSSTKIKNTIRDRSLC